MGHRDGAQAGVDGRHADGGTVVSRTATQDGTGHCTPPGPPDGGKRGESSDTKSPNRCPRKPGDEGTTHVEVASRQSWGAHHGPSAQNPGPFLVWVSASQVPLTHEGRRRAGRPPPGTGSPSCHPGAACAVL